MDEQLVPTLTMHCSEPARRHRVGDRLLVVDPSQKIAIVILIVTDRSRYIQRAPANEPELPEVVARIMSNAML